MSQTPTRNLPTLLREVNIIPVSGGGESFRRLCIVPKLLKGSPVVDSSREDPFTPGLLGETILQSRHIKTYSDGGNRGTGIQWFLQNGIRMSRRTVRET